MKRKYIIRDSRGESSPAIREAAKAKLADLSRASREAKDKLTELRRVLLGVPEYQEAFAVLREAEIAHAKATNAAFHYRYQVLIPWALGHKVAGKGDSRIEAIEAAKAAGEI